MNKLNYGKLICYYKNKLYLYKMKRNNIIISIERNKEPIARGNFKKLCNELKLPYHSLKMLKFPITHKDYVIFKVEFI